MNSAEDPYDNLRFETGIGPLTDKFLNSIFDKLTTENFKENLTRFFHTLLSI